MWTRFRTLTIDASRKVPGKVIRIKAQLCNTQHRISHMEDGMLKNECTMCSLFFILIHFNNMQQNNLRVNFMIYSLLFDFNNELLQFALKYVPIPSVPKILKSHESMFLALSCLQSRRKHSSGMRTACFSDSGVSLQRPPLERDPLWKKTPPLDRDPPWTEIPPGQTNTHF